MGLKIWILNLNLLGYLQTGLFGVALLKRHKLLANVYLAYNKYAD